MTSTAAAIPTVAEINNAEAVSEFTIQKQELDRLKEQQNLLRKIVDQQKEVTREESLIIIGSHGSQV